MAQGSKLTHQQLSLSVARRLRVQTLVLVVVQLDLLHFSCHTAGYFGHDPRRQFVSIHDNGVKEESSI
jgi:hypothetical protein